MNALICLLVPATARTAAYVFGVTITALASVLLLNASHTGAQNAALAAAKGALAQADWKALAAFVKRLRSDPEQALIASHMRAYAAYREGRYNDAEREGRVVRKRVAAGGRLSNSYIGMASEYPNNIHAFLVLGDAYTLERNFPDAIKALERAREIDNNDPHSHTLLGVAMRNAGQVDKAVGLYRRAIDLDSKFAPGYLGLGAAYLFQRKFTEAERVLRKAVEIRPDYADAWLNLGLAHRNKGSVDQAITSYQKAISFDPDYALAYVNLGAAFYYNGNYGKARQAWEKVVALDPDALEAGSARRNLSRLPR